MNNKQPNPTKLAVREAEAAEMLGIAAKTLRNWRYMTPIKGPRPARVGRAVVYPIAEIEKYIDENMIG